MKQSTSGAGRRRRAMLQLSVVFASFVVFGVALLSTTYSTLLPWAEQKIESLRYRVLELEPLPPHTEFVPTPLPTPTEEAVIALAPTETPTPEPTGTPTLEPTLTRTPTPTVPVKAVQASIRLTGVTHDYQRWNNCGPTTLEMYLSFFGIHDPQAQIAAVLKPDPEDKNVRPDEMIAYAQQDGMNALIRVNGTLDRIKLFLSNGLPLIVETGFDPPQAHQGWMGHYRLITGYTDKAFITQDSYDGPNVMVDFATLDSAWQNFDRTYIVLYTSSQAPLVRTIIGGDMEDATMYTNSVARARQELAVNPKDAFAAFNLGTSYNGLGRYQDAAAAFDQARMLDLPWRMLWYQFGPYVAYLKVGRYQEVVSLADATLKVVNDLEESHYYKGLALEALGNPTQARVEFTSALTYNKNYADARLALTRLQ